MRPGGSSGATRAAASKTTAQSSRPSRVECQAQVGVGQRLVHMGRVVFWSWFPFLGALKETKRKATILWSLKEKDTQIGFRTHGFGSPEGLRKTRPKKGTLNKDTHTHKQINQFQETARKKQIVRLVFFPGPMVQR